MPLTCSPPGDNLIMFINEPSTFVNMLNASWRVGLARSPKTTRWIGPFKTWFDSQPNGKPIFRTGFPINISEVVMQPKVTPKGCYKFRFCGAVGCVPASGCSHLLCSAMKQSKAPPTLSERWAAVGPASVVHVTCCASGPCPVAPGP